MIEPATGTEPGPLGKEQPVKPGSSDRCTSKSGKLRCNLHKGDHPMCQAKKGDVTVKWRNPTAPQ